MKEPKEDDSLVTIDFTPSKATFASSLMDCKPISYFLDQFKGKKAQSNVDKMRKTFFQVKINISLLDDIQQMSYYAHVLKELH